MIRRTVFALGILLGLSVHAKVKKRLLIVSDDLKADALGCYGSEIAQTPNVDQLAQEGTLFQNAYCQGTVCRPSRASFMRWRYHGEKEITWGEHFQKTGIQVPGGQNLSHARTGRHHRRTDGDGVPACWSARHNMPGKSPYARKLRLPKP